jgi:hypothetical protein
MGGYDVDFWQSAREWTESNDRIAPIAKGGADGQMHAQREYVSVLRPMRGVSLSAGGTR